MALGIQVKFRGDSTHLDQTVKKIGGSGEKLAGSLKASFAGLVGGLSAGVILSQFKGLTEEFARIDDLSKRLGTDAETTQKLGRAAALAGADVEILARSLTKVEVAIGKTGKEGEKTRETLARLGIDAEAFSRAKMDERVVMLADAYKAADGNATAFSDILGIMGVKAADLIPLLKEGGDTLRQTMGEMKVLSNEQVAALAKLDDQWTEFMADLKVSGMSTALALKEAFAGTYEALQELVGLEPPRVWGATPEMLAKPMDMQAPESETARRNREADEAGRKLEAEAAAAMADPRKIAETFREGIRTLFPGIGRASPGGALELLLKKSAIDEAAPSASDRETARDYQTPAVRSSDLLSDLARQGGAMGLVGGGSNAQALLDVNRQQLQVQKETLGALKSGMGSYS